MSMFKESPCILCILSTQIKIIIKGSLKFYLDFQNMSLPILVKEGTSKIEFVKNELPKIP